MTELLSPATAGEFEYLPFFYSRVFALSWQFYGLNEGECTTFGTLAAPGSGAYWVQGGAVVGAFIEGGSAEQNAAIKKVVEARAAAPADLAQQGLAFALTV